MNNYILRRSLKTMQEKVIQAENWDQAIIQLEDFTTQPTPDGSVVISNSSYVEFVGEEGVSSSDASVAAIKFALSRGCECPMDFLRCWTHGEFKAIREGWPEAPKAVFIGADPLYGVGD